MIDYQNEVFMKIVYFDVEDYETKFLKKHNENKFTYFLEHNSLNDITKINPQYIDAEIISVFKSSQITKSVLKQFTNLKLIALRSVGYNNIDIDSMPLSELISFVQQNPSVLKRPIILNEKSMVVGYDESEIEIFDQQIKNLIVLETWLSLLDRHCLHHKSESPF